MNLDWPLMLFAASVGGALFYLVARLSEQPKQDPRSDSEQQ